MTATPHPGTLEAAGIYPGSSFLATPEEVAETERLDAERIARGNAHMDSVLGSLWAARDQAAEDRAADWLDFCEEARRRRDRRRQTKAG
jgi:hypothetical protein